MEDAQCLRGHERSAGLRRGTARRERRRGLVGDDLEGHSAEEPQSGGLGGTPPRASDVPGGTSGRGDLLR